MLLHFHSKKKNACFAGWQMSEFQLRNLCCLLGKPLFTACLCCFSLGQLLFKSATPSVLKWCFVSLGERNTKLGDCCMDSSGMTSTQVNKWKIQYFSDLLNHVAVEKMTTYKHELWRRMFYKRLGKTSFLTSFQVDCPIKLKVQFWKVPMKVSGTRWFVERWHWTRYWSSQFRPGAGFAAVLQENFVTAERCFGQ